MEKKTVDTNLEIIGIENQICEGIMVDLNCWDSVVKVLNDLKRKEKKIQKEHLPPLEVLNLRKYQIELCNEALQGLNALICAPTGSGKTIVAIKIILEHVKSNPNARVIFLVPTVTLVEQQANQIRRYISKNFKIRELTGGENNIGGGMWTNFDVMVMTPQLLLNELMSSTTTKIKLHQLSLILFDECHHSSKKHPYNEIMKIYFDLKYKSLETKLPQIVGLTASVGVGDGKKLADALEYVLNICSNIDAQALCTTKENIDELNTFVNLPVDIVVEVPFIHETEEFSKQIIELIVLLESKIEPILALLQMQSKKPSNCEYTVPDRKWAPEYTTWVYGWLHYAPTLIHFEFAETLGIYLAHLEAYHLSLDILAHLPLDYAYKFLLDFMETKRKLCRNESEGIPLTLFEDKQDVLFVLSTRSDNDNLIETLKQTLVDEYKKNSDSRTLIFVRTCQIAKLLEDFIGKDEDLKFLNAGRLTGVNTKRLEGGQTASEQKEQMVKFRTGYHKVMIATTVVEEGLDVEQCNLVIKYNHSTNEIGHVQRRGRGRAFKSKSILITHDKMVADRERANISREDMMHQVENVIHNKGRQWFAKQIETRCALQYDDRLKESEKIPFTYVPSKNANNFILKCIKCDKYLLSSNNISQSGSHFVCVDPSLWSRLCQRSLSAVGAGSKICCSCQQEFGTILKFDSALLPVISINSFVLFDPIKNIKANPRKWKDVLERYLISIDPIKTKDLKPMFVELENIRNNYILTNFLRLPLK